MQRRHRLRGRTAPAERAPARRPDLAQRHDRGEGQGRRDAGRVPGNFRYNLLDHNVRRFNAQVPSVVQWDDHEVRNNWYPGQILDDARYTEKNVDILAARSARAFHEYFPVSAPQGSYGTSSRRSRMYRTVHHGPLLDVFVLDMRSHRNRNSPGGRPTTPPASSVPSSSAG